MLWHLLQRSWLLILLGVLALLIILSALILPQLPAYYANNPIAASRWLAEASDTLAFGGNIIRALGLFDVLHSTLLRLLLTLIGLTLAIHFADLLAAAIHLYRLPKQITKPAEKAGGVVSLLSPILVRRKSTSSSHSLDEQIETVQTYLSERYDHIEEADIDSATGGLLPEDTESEENRETPISTEKRIFARRHLAFSFLRPLLMLGLLISLIPVWNITVFGWELSPEPIAPGGTIRYEPNDLLIRYEMTDEELTDEETADEETADIEATSAEKPDNSGSTAMNLHIQIGEDEQTFPINKSLRTTLNQVEIRATSGPPALRISVSNGAPKLALQNQSAASASVGLVFAEPGNEGIVLIPSPIPEQATYLRIVRGPEEAEPYFLIEVLDYEGNQTQSQRMPQVASQNLEISPGNTQLKIDSVSGLNVTARYLPTTWLFIPALLLVIAGALGYWRRPAFIFAQIFERANQQTVSIYQSDTRSELEAI